MHANPLSRATVVMTGRMNLATAKGGASFAIGTVKAPDLEPDDLIIATAQVSRGGLGPNGLGPLYVPFIDRKWPSTGPGKPTNPPKEFDIVVYDISAAAHAISIDVDFAVLRPLIVT